MCVWSEVATKGWRVSYCNNCMLRTFVVSFPISALRKCACFCRYPPAVVFAQSVDRQLSLKPDGRKFSHVHAHARHPSAGSHGIGEVFPHLAGAQAVAEVPAAGVCPDA